MGGKLDLISAKDQGTTFFFSIPLEEVGTTEPNYHHAFQELTIGKYQQEIPTVLDNYLGEYFDYFGPTVKFFESVGELRELYELNVCKNYWIDIDKAKQNIIDALSNIDKSKLVIIANVTSRNKVEELGIDQDNVIFKPVTLTKLRNILIRSANTTPELVEKTVQAQATRFDAKILVAEDNIINQKLIRRVLEDHGVTVDIANNGLEAFEKRRNNDYDLIFMDIQMPVMDGIEATHEILDYEEDEEVPHVPIVALTANALKGDRERFLSEGMDEYITKPLETAELLYVLNKFLSHKAKQVDVNTSVDSVATKKTQEVQSDNAEDKATTDSKPQQQKNNVQNRSKKILIAKKLPLESKLLAKIIENLDYDYDIKKENENIAELIASGDYDIIITDEELIKGKLIPKKIYVITDAKTKNEIEVAIKTHRGM
jgi:CheY-like chemotaxis protein